MIGRTISHYKISSKLGGGGMGVVYKAADTKLKRTVALTFLPSELTHDPETEVGFIHEARAGSALDPPSICTILEIDETYDGELLIAMACYVGETLNKKIEQGSSPIHCHGDESWNREDTGVRLGSICGNLLTCFVGILALHIS